MISATYIFHSITLLILSYNSNSLHMWLYKPYYNLLYYNSCKISKSIFSALNRINNHLINGTLTLSNQYNQFKPHNFGFFCVKFSEF